MILCEIQDACLTHLFSLDISKKSMTNHRQLNSHHRGWKLLSFHSWSLFSSWHAALRIFWCRDSVPECAEKRLVFISAERCSSWWFILYTWRWSALWNQLSFLVNEVEFFFFKPCCGVCGAATRWHCSTHFRQQTASTVSTVHPSWCNKYSHSHWIFTFK